MAKLDKKYTFLYRVMRYFADLNNDLHEYALLHHVTWAICGFILLPPVMVLAIYCDFSVLYGIFFNVSQNFNSSLWQSAVGAFVIAVLIMAAGNMFIKLSINDKHGFFLKKRRLKLELQGKNKASIILRENAIQWYIYGTLTAIGLVMTGFLSWHSDERTKAEASNVEAKINAEHLANDAALDSAYKKDREALQAKFTQDSTTLSIHHDALIAAAAPQLLESLKNWELKLERKQVTKEQYQKSAHYLRLLISEKEKAPISAKANAILDLNAAHLKAVQSLENRHIQAKTDNDPKQEKLDAIKQSIAIGAISTKGLNLLLNLISLVLSCGLQFFYRGANVGQKIEDDKPLLTKPKKGVYKPLPRRKMQQKSSFLASIPFEDDEDDDETENDDKNAVLDAKNVVFAVTNSYDNTDENDEDSDKHYMQVIDHEGKKYNRSQVLTFMRTYRTRANKYSAEGKHGLVGHNLKMAEYWESRIGEFDN